MSMKSIEILAKHYAQHRELLSERVIELEDEIGAIKRRKLPGIRIAVQDALKAKKELEGAIATMPGLFDRPRTQILHGIKVGFRKAKGVIAWTDPARVVALIKKHLADQAEVLIKTTETPVKDAIAQLSAEDLKRIGCTVTATSDQVVVAPADSDVDKLVDALLKDEPEVLEKAA
jgi:hypothetical protein